MIRTCTIRLAHATLLLNHLIYINNGLDIIDFFSAPSRPSFLIIEFMVFLHLRVPKTTSNKVVMPVSASRDVQHGLQTWIDYDRPWILRRQFLVSEQTASILSNLVAMSLTLTGPRLWILLKAFFFWALAHYERRFKRRSTHGEILGHALVNLPRESNGPTSQNQNQPHTASTHSFSMSDNLTTIKDSHSELGAALDLIAKVLKLLKADRIQLFIPSPRSRRHCQSLRKVARRWNNFIQQPVDVVVPLILSAAFIGLFVAQSSGSILSARILTDKIALSIFPRCLNHTDGALSFGRASAYAKQCYRAEDGAEGCNFFYNQTIGYIEKANETCPFRGKTCAWGRNSAISFDTGLVDAHFLGINAPKKYQFRRKMLCAPFLPDGGFIMSKSGTGNKASIKYSPSPALIIGSKKDNRMWIGRRLMFDTASHAIDPLYFSNESINSTYVTIFEIFSEGVIYGEIRDDPVFPALQWLTPMHTFNNETLPGLLGCVENISFCDPDLKKCWNYPEPFDFGEKYRPITGKAPRIFYDMGPKPDLARALLYSSMALTFICIPKDYELEGNSHCIQTSFCGDLPRNQWKVEARQMFETSLASMQFNVFDIVRGGNSGHHPTIPANFQGICRMGKFKSTGWQNVSFWGLFGLMFLAAAISLASVRTEKEELWLVLGAVLTYRAFMWGKSQLKTILWASIPLEMRVASEQTHSDINADALDSATRTPS